MSPRCLTQRIFVGAIGLALADASATAAPRVCHHPALTEAVEQALLEL